ncbi:hypothetical protein, partial [Caballeronia sp. LZ043]|uniref:hypothetical protein n=1 Tax=Caballeronia sp. LZ043 TaxID=3038569 RepID=UPI00285B6B54
SLMLRGGGAPWTDGPLGPEICHSEVLAVLGDQSAEPVSPLPITTRTGDVDVARAGCHRAERNASIPS